MTRLLAPILFLPLISCDGGASPSRPADPLTLAAVETTLDFADAPLTGEVRAVPMVEAADLRYAVDLDGDGRPEAAGPLLDGVRVGYRYETPGVHHVRVRFERGAEVESWRQAVVVNRPDALEVLREARVGPAAAIVATTDEERVYVSVPGEGRVDAVRGFGLQRVWELELDFGEEGGGLALSPDERILYVDVGDSIVAIETVPTPRVTGTVGAAERGAGLATLPDGTILTGGKDGLARVDPATGAVLSRYDGPAGPFAASADGRRVAFVTPRGSIRSTVHLLGAEDLTALWSATLEVGFPHEATAAPSPDGSKVYALIRADDRRFVVLNGRDGAVERTLVVGSSDRATHGPRFLRSAAASPDGRWVAMVDDRHVWLVDTRIDLPLHRMDGSCCLVAASGERDVLFVIERSGELRKVEVLP